MKWQTKRRHTVTNKKNEFCCKRRSKDERNFGYLFGAPPFGVQVPLGCAFWDHDTQQIQKRIGQNGLAKIGWKVNTRRMGNWTGKYILIARSSANQTCENSRREQVWFRAELEIEKEWRLVSEFFRKWKNRKGFVVLKVRELNTWEDDLSPNENAETARIRQEEGVFFQCQSIQAAKPLYDRHCLGWFRGRHHLERDERATVLIREMSRMGTKFLKKFLTSHKFEKQIKKKKILKNFSHNVSHIFQNFSKFWRTYEKISHIFQQFFKIFSYTSQKNFLSFFFQFMKKFLKTFEIFGKTFQKLFKNFRESCVKFFKNSVGKTFHQFLKNSSDWD